MGYKEALEEAGALVHAFQNFGSYQGEWYAFITYGNEQGWVQGSFGSCSGCDSFQAEFGSDDRGCEEHSYDPDDQCDNCAEKVKEYAFRLADFGRVYCEGFQNTQAIVDELKPRSSWDGDSDRAVEWILETEQRFAHEA